MRLAPKNWREFQHYKDRSPPWIRLQRKLLDDRDFHRLPVASRALAPMLWLLASESVDGAFDGSPAELAFRLRQSEREVVAALNPLIEAKFFTVVQEASDALAERLHGAVPETETETEALQTQRQCTAPDDGELFERFWKAWPKHEGKKKAAEAFAKLKPDEALLQRMLAAIEAKRRTDSWTKSGGQFIPLPATWLNGMRWEDEVGPAAGQPPPQTVPSNAADVTARLLAEQAAHAAKAVQGPDALSRVAEMKAKLTRAA